MSGNPDLSRRQLFFTAAALVGGVGLAACQGVGPVAKPQGILQPGATTTVEGLLSRTPFYVAHRGSGDNWTEHSMESYAESVRLGVGALEVSVHATSDGVLVCHHDSTLKRLTGDPRKISQLTHADLAGLSLDARLWLGPASKPQTIPDLKDVLDRFAGTQVIFIEDKQGTNTEALLDLMEGYPNSTEHFIWKQSFRGAHTTTVQSRGYKVWGYFDADQAAQFAAIVPTLDLVGLPVDADDDLFRRLVGYGKPVMAWEVHTRSQRDRLSELGVRGMMCSNIPYVCRDKALHSADTFASGLRAAGDLPSDLEKGWGVQPIIDATAGSVTIKTPETSGYLLGSLCPIAETNYSLTVDLRWPVWLPKPQQYAAIAFGQLTDQSDAAATGYYLALQPDGQLGLFSGGPGMQGGTLLGSMQTENLQEQGWVSLTIFVNPEEIRIVRDSNPEWMLQIKNAADRGGYISLHKGYPEALPVQFRGITVAKVDGAA
ncbi:hypothetical protein CVS30_15955 [Arthrobacter psychrolactophilus]|uniref:GP-PDE domain-containing protein n=1 Tax=Arthrobacter psychrolactophilus TaxID=92442 RepID=A0A2V5JDJ7_9MICC|nr:hypothetical protein CVS30_15955 [Arthrobacter psychrolactophilus]